jgi:hypothetical protein
VRKVLLALSTTALLGAGLVVAPPANADACSTGLICLFSDFHFNGSKYTAWKCGIIYNLGAEWGSDQVRSYINTQTGHVTATFYNWSGSSWDAIGYSRAPQVLHQTPTGYYTAPGGVDGVKPC